LCGGGGGGGGGVGLAMCPPRSVVVAPRRVFPAWPRKIRRRRYFRLPVHNMMPPRLVFDRRDFDEYFYEFFLHLHGRP